MLGKIKGFEAAATAAAVVLLLPLPLATGDVSSRGDLLKTRRYVNVGNICCKFSCYAKIHVCLIFSV